MATPITHTHVQDWYKKVHCTRLTPMVLGAAGVGKTQSAIEYAHANNLIPKIIPLDSLYEMDVVGYAVPNKVTRKFDYFPSNFFPVAGDEIPAGKDGWLLIVDEFGNCGDSMQVAAQRLIFERIVGEMTVHDAAKFIILGNTIESGANANAISTAVLTRCAVVELVSSTAESIAYLNSKGYDPLLSSLYTSIVVHNAPANTNQATEPSNIMAIGQAAIFSDRGYEEFCKLVHCEMAAKRESVIPVVMDLVQNHKYLIASILSDKVLPILHSAIAKISSQLDAVLGLLRQNLGNVGGNSSDTALLTSAFITLFSQNKQDCVKYLNNFIQHNEAQNNMEPVVGVLSGLNKLQPAVLAHSSFDFIKARFDLDKA